MQKKCKCKGIINAIKNNLTITLAITIVAVIAMFFYSYLFVTPTYTSSATVCLKYENSGNFSCEDPHGYVNDSVDAFVFSLSTKDAKNNAEEELSKKDQRYKNVNIKNTEIEVGQIDDTNLVNIYVTSSDNRLSSDLCNVYTEIALIYAQKIGNVTLSVVESPIVSESPSSPNIFVNCIIIAGAAFILTTVIMVIKSSLDKKIREGKEIEKQTDILFLGNIESINDKNSKDAEQSYIITNPNTSENIKESYVSLCDNVRFALAPTNGKIIAITSYSNEEGKSTVAVNLAIAMAQSSAKVLLIDSDTAKPVIHKRLKLRNIKGFSSFIAGFDSLSDVLKRDVVPGLDVITSGAVPPNPRALFKSNNTKVFFEKIREYYDYILIDCACVLPDEDVMLLSESIDGAIVTTKYAYTTFDGIKSVKSSLENSKVKILGFVITEKVYNKSDRVSTVDGTQNEIIGKE